MFHPLPLFNTWELFPQGLVQGYTTVTAMGKYSFRQNFTAEAPEALVDLLKDGDAQLPCVYESMYVMYLSY